MKVEDCYQLGEVIKTHGLNGEVSILLDVDNPSKYSELESVFVQQGQTLIPFFIDSIQINEKKALVGFEDIESIEQAQELVNCKLFLPLSFLPNLGEGNYYFHDLVSCKVFENEKLLGIVKEVIDLSGNELLVVTNDSKEILIPIKDEILINVSIDSKRIDVRLPEGLLELYT